MQVCNIALQGESGKLLPAFLGVETQVEAMKSELGFV
jgi:hypothetical protein